MIFGRKTLFVYGSGNSELVEALSPFSSIFPLDIRSDEQLINASGADAILALEPSDKEKDFFLSLVKDTLFLTCSPSLKGRNICFTDAASVPAIFRNVQVSLSEFIPFSEVPLSENSVVMATCEGIPCWSRNHNKNRSTDIVGFRIDWSKRPSLLVELSRESGIIPLLPLLDFLKRLFPLFYSTSPRLTANIMFDDPNLHWSTYGYVNYASILQNAREFRYHASFATVPLDCWYAHPSTSAVFRENPEFLSLLVHGNNHTSRELLGNADESRELPMLAQASRRIQRFEAKTGLKISRVMAAPHGACSERMMMGMAKLGFEAACISAPSVRGNNSDKPWISQIGFRRSDLIGGLPIIPRFGVHWRGWRLAVRIAAFLEQPIIVVGHHDALKDGLSPLETFATFVNSLGNVIWSDLTAIARQNFSSHVIGRQLYVLPYSRRIKIQVPMNAEQLMVQWPWPNDDSTTQLEIRLGAHPFSHNNLQEPFQCTVTPGETVDVVAAYKSPVSPDSVKSPRTALWEHVRRPLGEIRDRLRPYTDRLRNG